MAPPPNTTATTAIEIPTLSTEFTYSQNVHDAGITYSVWYKYTPVADDKVIGFRFYGDPAVYRPSTTIYIDDEFTILFNSFGSAPNWMGQLPTLTGRLYLFRVITNGGNPSPAVLNVSVLRAQDNLPPPRGSIVIRTASITTDFQNAGYTGMPVGYINAGSGTIFGFAEQVPPGESGDYMPNSGEILFGNEYYPGDFLEMYTPNMELIHSHVFAITGSFPLIRTNRELRRFYIMSPGLGITDGRYITMDEDGNTTGPFILTGFNVQSAIASSPDGGYVYCAGVGSSLNSNVRRWNTSTLMFDSDLVPVVANYLVRDILVMSNGNVCILYHRSAIDDIFVRIYNSAGVLQNTWNAPVVPYTTTAPRLGYANDDSVSFWVFLHQSDAFSRFIQVRVSDVAQLTNITTPDAFYLAQDLPSPAYRFVTSDSCPLVLALTVAGGIYFIDPTHDHDSYYGDIETKIPDPTFKTGLIGE